MPSKSRQLSRREREIMDIVYARGEASAADVSAALADPPSYSSVRTLLRILEEKGHLKHREDGPRYVFLPTEPRAKASRSALRRVVETFFDGSSAKAVAALLGGEAARVTDEELERIAELVDNARGESR